MKQPIIGILPRVHKISKPDLFLYDEYRVAILGVGGIPILLLPPYSDDIESHKPFSNDMTRYQETIQPILNICDGFLFPGGEAWYGFDQYVLDYAYRHNKPVLGICLGMQLMANMGYFQDDNSDHTEVISSFINHKCEKKYVHSVHIFSSKLKDILHTDNIKVNSRHSSKVEDQSYFLVSSVSLDHVIESIEIPNQKFMIGVQWHPETLIPDDIYAQKLFMAFIDACR